MCYIEKQISEKMIDGYIDAINRQFKKETNLNIYCSILVSDPFYSLLYDGFETILKEIKLSSIESKSKFSFISMHNQKVLIQCFNAKFKELHYFERKNHILQLFVTDEVIDLTKTIESSTINNFDEIIDTINTMRNTMIVIVGPPGVGKTRFSEQLKGVKMRYIRMKIPNRKVRENVIVYLDDKKDDQNIIIDGENATERERYIFINTCKYRNMHTLCVFFNYKRNVCDYITKYIYNESLCKAELKSSRGITRYYNRLQKPKYVEGIDQIIEINQIPLKYKNKIY
tara:strand:- start:92 stop:946 length:855 start_codon:yes stop_codon:yes gene_type:complete